MKYVYLLVLVSALLLLGACTYFDSRQAAPSAMQSAHPLTLPIGTQWQIIEEPPKLSDDRGRLPFQTEQSVQPEQAKPVVPADNRTLETPR
jgi:hypothetical protein